MTTELLNSSADGTLLAEQGGPVVGMTTVGVGLDDTLEEGASVVGAPVAGELEMGTCVVDTEVVGAAGVGEEEDGDADVTGKVNISGKIAAGLSTEFPQYCNVRFYIFRIILSPRN